MAAQIFEWIVGHPADILICSAILVLVVIGIKKAFQNHKNGCGGCSGGCGACSHKCDKKKK